MDTATALGAGQGTTGGLLVGCTFCEKGVLPIRTHPLESLTNLGGQVLIVVVTCLRVERRVKMRWHSSQRGCLHQRCVVCAYCLLIGAFARVLGEECNNRRRAAVSKFDTLNAGFPGIISLEVVGGAV